MFTHRALAIQAVNSLLSGPIRSKVAASHTTANSGSSFGQVWMRPARGNRAHVAGTPSVLTTSACAPSDSAMSEMAIAAPIVSASGFSWQMAVTRFALRRAVITSAAPLMAVAFLTDDHDPSTAGGEVCGVAEGVDVRASEHRTG
jgi:hypothetical protein